MNDIDRLCFICLILNVSLISYTQIYNKIYNSMRTIILMLRENTYVNVKKKYRGQRFSVRIEFSVND